MSQQNLNGNSGSSMSENDKNELLNKLHLLDENGEIKLDRLMDRKGTQNRNKYVYDQIKSPPLINLNFFVSSLSNLTFNFPSLREVASITVPLLPCLNVALPVV